MKRHILLLATILAAAKRPSKPQSLALASLAVANPPSLPSGKT